MQRNTVIDDKLMRDAPIARQARLAEWPQRDQDRSLILVDSSAAIGISIHSPCYLGLRVVE